MRSVFRQVSLERLSSPEQLDALMQVTNPQSWLAFLALAGLLIAGAYWSVAGSISIQVSAPTILLNSGGIKNLLAIEDGQITELYIAEDDIVEAGQLVAKITLPGSNETVPVYSVYNGRIVELKTDMGDLITRGEPLASLEFVGEFVRLESTLYLSPEDSQQVKVGMPVKIVPRTTTNSDDILTGKVVSISEFPISHEAILRTLGSNELIQSLVSANPSIEIRVAIESGTGQTGTLANAIILVDTQRPIELILPIQ